MCARCRFAPLVTFALALGVYLLTAPPGLTWAFNSADGGDLISAAAHWGVPHPSGYPTWTMLAGLLLRFLPVGALAWRAALLSMFSAAAAAALTTATVPLLSRSRGAAGAWAGIWAGALLAVAPTWWGQAIVAEVYALHAACAAALLWALAHWRVDGGLRWAAAAGVFLGLGLGNHLTTLAWLPAALWLLPRPAQTRPAILAFAAAALLTTAALMSYLPLAAAAHPPVNWGNPQTLAGWWWLASGQWYHSYVWAAPAAVWLERLSAWAGLLWRELLPWGVIAVALGVVLLWQRQRRWATAFGVGLLTSLFWVLGYNTPDAWLSWLPGYVVLALAAGVGAAAVLKAVGYARLRAAVVALAMLLALWPALARWPQQTLRRDRAAEQFYQAVLHQVAPDATVLARGDRAVFALWYGHTALGLRRDVAVIAPDLWGAPGYVDTVRRTVPGWADANPTSWRTTVAAQGRPLYLAQSQDGATHDPQLDWPDFRFQLALAGDGWVLWRMTPMDSK